jgi:hypothetical protein
MEKVILDMSRERTLVFLYTYTCIESEGEYFARGLLYKKVVKVNYS